MFQTHYERIGGETKIRALVEAFYRHMDEMPETYAIRKMHAEDLSGSRQKLFEFLSGWMGGPQLFVEKHGQPMLRQRHIHFAIGDAERDQWLTCMKLALADAVDSAPLRDELYAAFVKVADHMRNQARHHHHH